MRVGGRRFGRVVPQILLNQAQVHPGFEQVGGVGVAQGRDMRVFGAAGLLEGRAKGHLHAAFGHGCGRGGRADAAPSGGGEEPHRVAMGCPIGAQELERRLRQGDIPVLAAFAEADMHEHPGAVDLAHLQVRPFCEA